MELAVHEVVLIFCLVAFARVASFSRERADAGTREVRPPRFRAENHVIARRPFEPTSALRRIEDGSADVVTVCRLTEADLARDARVGRGLFAVWCARCR